MEMEMDEEMEEFHCVEVFTSEMYDPNYEFDAPRCYDFSRPETYWEASEAERWFDSEGDYPPSPFLAKLNVGKGVIGDEKVSPRLNDQEHIDSTSMAMDDECGTASAVPASDPHIKDYEMCQEGFILKANAQGRDGNEQEITEVQEAPKVPKKSVAKPPIVRSSTLMKPTASHLAKLRQPQEINRLSRSQKLPSRNERTPSPSSSVPDNDATKRQKLEAGYLQKVAHLKHRPLLPHKLCRKVTDKADLVHARPKVTVPKEPDLETARRAQRRGSKSSVVSIESTKSCSHLPKPRSFNRKIIEVPSVPIPRKSTSQLVDTQTIKTTASRNEETEIKRPISVEVSKHQKHGSIKQFKACKPEKDPNFSKNKHDVPVNLLAKLTLEPEARPGSRSQSKVSKENAPLSTQQEHEEAGLTSQKSSTFTWKQLHCGRDRRNTGREHNRPM